MKRRKRKKETTKTKNNEESPNSGKKWGVIAKLVEIIKPLHPCYSNNPELPHSSLFTGFPVQFQVDTTQFLLCVRELTVQRLEDCCSLLTRVLVLSSRHASLQTSDYFGLIWKPNFVDFFALPFTGFSCLFLNGQTTQGANHLCLFPLCPQKPKEGTLCLS